MDYLVSKAHKSETHLPQIHVTEEQKMIHVRPLSMYVAKDNDALHALSTDHQFEALCSTLPKQDGVSTLSCTMVEDTCRTQPSSPSLSSTPSQSLTSPSLSSTTTTTADVSIDEDSELHSSYACCVQATASPIKPTDQADVEKLINDAHGSLDSRRLSAAPPSPSGSIVSSSSKLSRFSSLYTRAMERDELTFLSAPEQMPQEREKRSVRKIAEFFGDTPPMDMSINEISRDGLEAMLRSRVPLCYFLKFLIEEFSSENLFFYLEIENYESFPFTSDSERRAGAIDIYQMYLLQDSGLEVNLSERCRMQVASKIYQSTSSEDLKHCFDAAKEAVTGLLEDSFMRFQNGPEWQRMEKELRHTSLYAEPARQQAISRLLCYMSPSTRAAMHGPGPLLGQLVAEFISMRFSEEALFHTKPRESRRGHYRTASAGTLQSFSDGKRSPLVSGRELRELFSIDYLRPESSRVNSAASNTESSQPMRRLRQASLVNRSSCYDMTFFSRDCHDKQSFDCSHHSHLEVSTRPNGTVASSGHRSCGRNGLLNVATIALKRSMEQLRNCI
jgi:hypothetical protein